MRQRTLFSEARPYLIILMLGAFVTAGWPVYSRIVDPGVRFDAHLWRNEFAVGYAWGSVGTLVPISYFMFFWTGSFTVIRRLNLVVGVSTILVLTAGMVYGAFRFQKDISNVWQSDVQREGLIYGAAGVLLLIAEFKIGFAVLFNRMPSRWRNRISDRMMHSIPESVTEVYDGAQDYSDV